MRIIYFIYVSAGGRGGHFHSLNQISLEIAKINPSIRIITIGKEESPVLTSNPLFNKHLHLSKLNFISFYKGLINEINGFNADVLHFFDARSYNIFFPLSILIKRKIVVNKCGGPNPKEYPIIPNLILFSKENKNWFLNKKRYNKTKIAVIPNRSSTIKPILQKRYLKNPDLFNIVRICRIGTTYYNSILNGINLIKELSKRNINAKLYIIGKVLEESKLKQLLSESEKYNIEFITEDEYTSEASKMLYLADAVIGTGRSAMEACSIGLPTLMPSKYTDFPILLNETNFQCYFEKNFTDRVEYNKSIEDLKLQEIIELINNKKYYNKISSFSLNVFNQYFDVSKAGKKYLEFYKKLNAQRLNWSILKINFKRNLSAIRGVFID